MADTKHVGPVPVLEPTEGDGISYKALGWSMVVLTIITLVCYALVAGFFKFMESRAISGDTVRGPLAVPSAQPSIKDGRVVGGPASGPELLVEEPMNLQKFRAEEEHQLTSYGWVDQNAGVVRMPIDRAMELLLQRGLAVRPGAPVAEVKPPHDASAETKPAAPQKAGAHK